jgi:hypothetical protein
MWRARLQFTLINPRLQSFDQRLFDSSIVTRVRARDALIRILIDQPS